MSWKSLVSRFQGLANLAISHQQLVQTLDDILLFFHQTLGAETVLCYNVLTYRLMQINKASEMHLQWSQHSKWSKQNIYSVYARLLRIQARLNMLIFLMKHQQVILVD